MNRLTKNEALAAVAAGLRVQMSTEPSSWVDFPRSAMRGMAGDHRHTFRWHPDEQVPVIVMNIDEPSDSCGIVIPVCHMPDPRAFGEWVNASKDDAICFVWSSRSGASLNAMEDFPGW